MLSLLLTIEPYQDETFTSFLLRTCQENQYESISWIAKLINIDSRQLAKPNPNKVNLKPLAQLLRKEEQELWDLTFYKDIIYFQSTDDPSSFKDHVNTEYDKVCPACFDKKPYIRNIWNIKINMACPYHSLLLVNICPNCNKKISSIRSEIHKCNCGYKLNNLPKIRLKKKEVLHSKIITNAFYGKQLFDENASILNNLSYHSITKLINSFWYRINLGRNGIGINQINTQETELFLQLISIFDLFIDWPHNFRDFLDENKQHPTVIKNIRRDLHTKLYDPEFHILMEEFLRYVEEQTKRPVRFNKYNKNHTNLISRTQAIKMTNMSTKTFNKLVENHILEEYVQVHNENFITRSITVESLEKFMEYKKFIVFKKDLADSIGLNSSHINLFEENNWIKRIELFSERNDKKSYYDIRFGEQLISKIENRNIMLKLDESIKETKCISFFNFYNRAATKGINFIELIEGLIDGHINIYKVPEKTGFKGYFFDLNEVILFIKKCRYRKFINKKIKFNTTEVCELLKVSIPLISSWNRFGFLGHEKNIVEFSYNEIEEFVDNYVTITQLSDIYQTSAARLLNSLWKNGIYPVSGAKVNGGAGYIYRRSNLENVLEELPRNNIKERIMDIILN